MPSFTSGGIFYPPNWNGNLQAVAATALGIKAVGPIDAAAEKAAFVGPVFLAGRAASKVMSSAGAKIHFRTASPITFADPASILGIGIQDVSATLGPPIQPDGTFDVSATITGSSTFTLTTNTWLTVAMTTGTKTISHGEQYAVVFDLSARGSTDSISIASMTHGQQDIPCALNFTASWQTPNGIPICLLETDDGTLGWFANSIGASSLTSVSLSSGAANDEMGLVFSLPWTCEIDQLVFQIGQPSGSAASALALLYSAPKTAPVTVTSVSVPGNQGIAVGESWKTKNVPLPVPITITGSTTYALAIRGTATAAAVVRSYQFANAAYRAPWPNGQGLYAGRRSSGGAGAFSLVSTEIPVGFAVRISAVGSASTVTVTTTTTITTAAGMLVHPSMTGGFRG